MAVLTDKLNLKGGGTQTVKKKKTDKAAALSQIKSQIEEDVNTGKTSSSASTTAKKNISLPAKTEGSYSSTGKAKLGTAAETRKIRDQIVEDLTQNAYADAYEEQRKKAEELTAGFQKFQSITDELHGLQNVRAQAANGTQYLNLDRASKAADEDVRRAEIGVKSTNAAVNRQNPRTGEDYLKRQGALYTPAYQTAAYQNAVEAAASNDAAVKRAESKLYTAQKNQSDVNNLKTARSYETKYLTAAMPEYESPAITVGNGGRTIAKAVNESLGKTARIGDESEAGGEWYNLAKYMSDAQKNVILNLANQGKYDEVETYANAIKSQLTEDLFTQQQKGIAGASKAGQVAIGVTNFLASPAAYAQIAADTVRGKYTDLNEGAVGATRAASFAQEKSLENKGTVGKLLGQTAYSMLNSTASAALGPVGSLIWIGTQAAGGQAIDTLERGGTQGQAVLSGAISGGIEAATEKLGLDNLFDTVLTSGAAGVKSLFRNIATQTLSEGSEELISEFAGNLADMAVMGEKSEYETRVRELKAAGASDKEARSEATAEFFVRNPAMAALAGSISGAMFGLGGTAVAGLNAAADAKSYNRNVAEYVNDADSLNLYIREGLMTLDNQSAGYKAAVELAKAQTAGKSIDAKALATLRASLDADTLSDIGRQEGINIEERAAKLREQQELDAAARQAEESAAREMNLSGQTQESSPIAETPAADPTVPADVQQLRPTQTVSDNSAEAMDAAARQAEESSRGTLSTQTQDLPTASSSVQETQQTTPAQQAVRTKYVTDETRHMSVSEKLNFKQELNQQFKDASGRTDVESVSAAADAAEAYINAVGDYLAGDRSAEVQNRSNEATQALRESLTKGYTAALTVQRDNAVRSMPKVREDYKKAYDHIRETKLYIPGDVKSEVGRGSWGEWRRKNGWLRTGDKKAMSIDTLFGELSSDYPGYFDENQHMTLPDQLTALSEFMTQEARYDRANETDIALHGGMSEAQIAEAVQTSVEQTIQDLQNSYWNARYTGGDSQASVNLSDIMKSLPRVTATSDVSAHKSVYEAGRGYSSEEIMRLTERSARENGVNATVSLEISNLAGKLGSKVEFADLGSRYNGYYNREADTVVLNSRLQANDAIWTTYAHELTHRAEAAKGYGRLKSFVLRNESLRSEAYNGVLDDIITGYAEAGVKLSRADAEHEFMAAYVSEKFLGSLDALRGVAETDPDAARVLLDSVEDVLTRSTENGLATDVAQDRLVRAQNILAEALDDVNRQRGSGRYAESGGTVALNGGYRSQESLTDYLPTGQAAVAGFNLDALIAKNVEKYGKIEPGEQIYDVDDPSYHTTVSELPAKAADDRNVRRFYRTADEAAAYDFDVRDVAVLDTYTPTTNEENVAQAIDIRSSYDSFDQAYGAFRKWAQSGGEGKDGAAQIAFGERLMLEARRSGRMKESVEILSDLATLGTDYGQRIQALSLLKRLTPEGQLYHYARQAESYAKRKKTGKASRKTREVQRIRDSINGAIDSVDHLEATAQAVKAGDATNEDFQRAATDTKHVMEELSRKLEPYADPTQSEFQQELDALTKRRTELERELGEKRASAEELAKIRREYNAIPGKIEAAQKKTLDNIAKQKELLGQLAERRAELERELNTLEKTRAERKALKAELAKTNSEITSAWKTWNRYAGDIRALSESMAAAEITLDNAKQYKKTIKTAQSVMQAYLSFVKNKGGEVIIDETLMENFINAKTEEDLAAAREALEQNIADQLPGSVSERIRAVRYIGMLLNPTTHIRNVFGNTVQLGMKNVRDVVATVFEKAFIKSGERTKAVLTGKDSGRKSFAAADYAEIKADLQAGGQRSETAGIEEKRQIFATPAAEAVRKFSSNTLEAEDALFLRRNYVNSFAEYMKANKLTPENITDAQKLRAREVAFEEALKATYRDASHVANLLNQIENSSAAAEFFMGGLMPFKKTPINVLKRGLEYSPAGLIKGVYDITQKARGKDVTASQIISDFSAGLTGTGVTILGAFLGATGAAFASAGSDEKDRESSMEEETGRQDYSIRFGDYTYTMDWVAPACMPFFIGVSLAQYAKRENKDLSASEVVDSVLGIMEPIFSLSMLSGITDMFESYESTGAGVASSVAWSALESYALQFFPTFGGKMARVVDDTRRSTYAPTDSPYSKKAEQLARRIIAKIPFASMQLEPSVDQYGNEHKNVGDTWWKRLLYNTLSPGYIQKVTSYEADNEMKRLYAATGDTSALPKQAPKNVTYAGQTYYLDSHAYTQFAKTLGQETYSGLEALYKTQEYIDASDADKVDMVAKVMDTASEKARMEYFEYIGLDETVYRDAIETALYGEDNQKKPQPSAVDLYNSGMVDIKSVYYAYDKVKDSAAGTKTSEKISALNALDLDEDEKSFIYMTKIASASAQADVQAIIDNGGVSMTEACSIVQSMYDYETGDALKKDGKIDALRSASLPDAAKESAYYALVSDSDSVKAQVKKFRKAGMDMDDFLSVQAAFTDADGEVKQADKLAALKDLDVSDKYTVVTTLVTTSTNIAKGMEECMKMGFTDDQFVDAYAKYAEINATDAKPSEKALEFSRWVNKTYSGKSEEARTFIKDVLSYYQQMKADAGKYDSLYAAGVSDSAAASIYTDLKSLAPLEGKASVSDNQKILAIATNSVANDAEKRIAILQIIGDSTSGQAKFTAFEQAKIPYVTYASYISTVSEMSADKDKNGKAISGSKKAKVMAYINSLPLSDDQKDAIYLAEGYAKSALGEAPWN